MKARDSRRSTSAVERFHKALKTRWLNGVEYFTLLTQHERLARILKIPQSLDSTHPTSIYFAPAKLPVYFLLADAVEDVSFLDKEGRKDFAWEKQQGVTCIPKQNPLVKYVSATGTCTTMNEEYKMHIIWKAEASDAPQKLVVVCHVMKQPNMSCKLKMAAGLNWKNLAAKNNRRSKQLKADQPHFDQSLNEKPSCASKDVQERPARTDASCKSIRKKFIFHPANDSLNVGLPHSPAEDRDLGKRDTEEDTPSIHKIVVVKNTEPTHSKVTDIFGPTSLHPSPMFKMPATQHSGTCSEPAPGATPKNLFRCTLSEPQHFDKNDYLAWIRAKLDSLNSG